MAERVLHTLFHVSDLHVGEIDADGYPGLPDAIVKRWWRIHKQCSGFLGHTFQAMRQLEEFFGDVADGVPTTLIVTGDLTTCGAASECEIATGFLTNEATFPPIDFARYTIRRIGTPGFDAVKGRTVAVLPRWASEARRRLEQLGYRRVQLFAESPLQKRGYADPFTTANFPLEIYAR